MQRYSAMKWQTLNAVVTSLVSWLIHNNVEIAR